jgi:hypothetical protein
MYRGDIAIQVSVGKIGLRYGPTLAAGGIADRVLRRPPPEALAFLPRDGVGRRHLFRGGDGSWYRPCRVSFCWPQPSGLLGRLKGRRQVLKRPKQLFDHLFHRFQLLEAAPDYCAEARPLISAFRPHLSALVCRATRSPRGGSSPPAPPPNHKWRPKGVVAPCPVNLRRAC